MAFVYWIHLPEHTDMLSQGYIGFTSKTVESRWKQHRDDSKRYPHLTLYKALVKYGEDLVVTTLVEGDNDYCLNLENNLRPKNKIGWNIKVGGDMGPIGVIPSEESRRKMSESRTGEKNHFFGKTHTDAQRAKWSVSRSVEGFPQKSQIKANETKKNNPWNVANARKDIWAKADIIKENLNQEITGKRLADLLDTSVHSIKTIVKKLKNGWCPRSDHYWLKFIENYKKELYESTFAT